MCGTQLRTYVFLDDAELLIFCGDSLNTWKKMHQSTKRSGVVEELHYMLVLLCLK